MIDQAPRLRAALRELVEQAGKPSQPEIKEQAELARRSISQQTLSDQLGANATRVPKLRTLLAIVDGCKGYARRTNPAGCARLEAEGVFDHSRWESLLAETESRTLDEAWPRVRDVSPLDAGVKVAAVLPSTDSPIALWLEHRGPRSGFPSYVPRDHDPKLGKTLDKAMASGTGAVVVVGRSCTGKSRSAWEAVLGRAPDWFFVNVRNPLEADRLLRAQPTEGKVLLWLDNVRAGSGVAAAITAALAVLKDRRRGYAAVAVATMWHAPAIESADTPTALEDSLAMKELAAYAGLVTTVEEPWSERELDDGRAAAANDALLAVALEQTSVSPPQLLAGSQWAVNRWTAPRLRETRAVLTAAIDLGRLGFGLDPRRPLTRSLLLAAAPAYLDRPPQEATWFDDALSEATEPLEDAVWALKPPFPGDDRPYVVFDPLLEYGKLVRFHEPLPAQVWTALAATDLTRDPVIGLADTAEHRLLFAVSRQLREVAEQSPPTPPVEVERRAPAPAPLPLPQPPPQPVLTAKRGITISLESPHRNHADLLLAEDRYDELVEFAIPAAGDPYIRRRLAMLYERHGEIDKLRDLATFSNRGGRHYVEYLCSTGALRELLRKVVAGDGHAHRAVERWTIEGLTDDDRRRILEHGLHPDGSPVAELGGGNPG